MAKKIFIVFVIIFLTTLLAFIIQSISSNEDSLLGGGLVEDTEGEFVVEGETKEEQKEGWFKEKEESSSGKISKLIDSKGGDVKGVVLNASTEQVLYYQKRECRILLV